jgi:hypothetical protein
VAQLTVRNVPDDRIRGEAHLRADRMTLQLNSSSPPTSFSEFERRFASLLKVRVFIYRSRKPVK